MSWSTPRVWAVAEVVTSGNMNTYISDDLAFLHGDAGAWITDAVVSPSAALAISKLSGYPTDGTKVLSGDGTWQLSGLAKLWDSTDAGVSFPCASITTATLPQTYKHLRIHASLRSDEAAEASNLMVRLNGDATNNYDAILGLTTLGNGISSLLGGGGYGYVVGGSAGANLYSAHDMVLPDYASTTKKKTMLFTQAGAVDTSAWAGAGYSIGTWRSTAGVTTITFLLPSANFVAGSHITVYGER